MAQSEISVLIPTRNRPDDLLLCLRSVAAQRPKPLEVVVVDQSQTEMRDEVEAVLRPHGLAVRYIHAPELEGLTHARNRAIAQASGSILLFVDDDVELDAGYLRAMLAVFDADPGHRIGAASGLIANFRSSISLAQRIRSWAFYRGPFSVERDVLAFHFRPGTHPRRGRRLHGCIAVRREVFERVRFDEAYRGYSFGEDRDFSVQVGQHYELRWVPGARLVHKQTQRSRLDRERFCELRILSWLRFYDRCVERTARNKIAFIWLNIGFLTLLAGIWDWATVRGTARGLWQLLRILRGRERLETALQRDWRPPPRPGVRVVHVINTVEVGGGAEHLARLIPGLTRFGFENMVVAGRDGPYAERLRDLGIPVTVLGSMTAGGLMALARVFLWMRPDLIHLHGSRSGLLGSLAARLTGTGRIVYTAHAFSFKRDLPRVLHAGTVLAERLTCALADAIICLTDEDARAAAGLGISARRVTVIPNGIDPAPFADAPDLRGALGIDPHAPVVGMISRLVGGKDPLTFVRSAAQVGDRLPGARFLLIGDGPLRAAVEEEVRRLGVADRVILAGVRNDIPALLATIDVVVLTSRWEGLPLVVLEAMAAGRPIVCSRVRTLAEVVQDGVTGRLVTPGDAAGFAEAIVALGADRSLRLALGGAAREHVVRAFPLQRMVEQTVGVYRGVLSAPQLTAPAPTTPQTPWA